MTPASPDAVAPAYRPIEHTVTTEPFDPMSVERMTPEQERYYLASQWQMMWWKFRRHRLAVVAGAFLTLLYASIAISEFLAPYNLHVRHVDFIYAPPQRVHLFDRDAGLGRSSTATAIIST